MNICLLFYLFLVNHNLKESTEVNLCLADSLSSCTNQNAILISSSDEVRSKLSSSTQILNIDIHKDDMDNTIMINDFEIQKIQLISSDELHTILLSYVNIKIMNLKNVRIYLDFDSASSLISQFQTISVESTNIIYGKLNTTSIQKLSSNSGSLSIFGLISAYDFQSTIDTLIIDIIQANNVVMYGTNENPIKVTIRSTKIENQFKLSYAEIIVSATLESHLIELTNSKSTINTIKTSSLNCKGTTNFLFPPIIEFDNDQDNSIQSENLISVSISHINGKSFTFINIEIQLDELTMNINNLTTKNVHFPLGFVVKYYQNLYVDIKEMDESHPLEIKWKEGNDNCQRIILTNVHCDFSESILTNLIQIDLTNSIITNGDFYNNNDKCSLKSDRLTNILFKSINTKELTLENIILDQDCNIIIENLICSNFQSNTIIKIKGSVNLKNIEDEIQEIHVDLISDVTDLTLTNIKLIIHDSQYLQSISFLKSSYIVSHIPLSKVMDCKIDSSCFKYLLLMPKQLNWVFESKSTLQIRGLSDDSFSIYYDDNDNDNNDNAQWLDCSFYNNQTFNIQLFETTNIIFDQYQNQNVFGLITYSKEDSQIFDLSVSNFEYKDKSYELGLNFKTITINSGDLPFNLNLDLDTNPSSLETITNVNQNHNAICYSIQIYQNQLEINGNFQFKNFYIYNSEISITSSQSQKSNVNIDKLYLTINTNWKSDISFYVSETVWSETTSVTFSSKIKFEKLIIPYNVRVVDVHYSSDKYYEHNMEVSQQSVVLIDSFTNCSESIETVLPYPENITIDNVVYPVRAYCYNSSLYFYTPSEVQNRDVVKITTVVIVVFLICLIIVIVLMFFSFYLIIRYVNKNINWDTEEEKSDYSLEGN